MMASQSTDMKEVAEVGGAPKSANDVPYVEDNIVGADSSYQSVSWFSRTFRSVLFQMILFGA